MKKVLKLLALTAAISSPSVLLAQQSGHVIAPSVYTGKGFNEPFKAEFKALTEPVNDSIGKSPFINHLPKIIPENRTLDLNSTQANPVYNSMPVVKPGKTSDIPVRKLDANSPYTYNMPIRKSGVAGKD